MEVRRKVEGVQKTINGYIADFMEYFYEPIVSTTTTIILKFLACIQLSYIGVKCEKRLTVSCVFYCSGRLGFV